MSREQGGQNAAAIDVSLSAKDVAVRDGAVRPEAVAAGRYVDQGMALLNH